MFFKFWQIPLQKSLNISLNFLIFENIPQILNFCTQKMDTLVKYFLNTHDAAYFLKSGFNRETHCTPFYVLPTMHAHSSCIA